jgi:hypothetical protein
MFQTQGGKHMYKYEKIIKSKTEELVNGFISLTINDLEDASEFSLPEEITELKNIRLEIKIKKLYFYIDFEV